MIMGWRLAIFRTRRLRRPALIVLAALLLTLAGAVGWRRLTQQDVRLTISVTDAAFVSTVAVQPACCQPLVATISLAAPTATFVVPRGEYTITAAPSSAGYFQHWYFIPTTIHLDADRTVTIRGAYGQG